MRKLIMWNLVTLDGFFEGASSWALDWHDYVWGEELKQLSIEQLTSADLLLFGRVTYEGMAKHWPSATGAVADLMNRIPKAVFSRTLTKADWSNTTLVREPAEREVAKLKQQPGRDALIFGSAALSASLMQQALIDEYRLVIVPVVLGVGTSLFKPSAQPTRMELLESRELKSGGVILRYRPRLTARGATPAGPTTS
jgi:dihydrofolate reductase